MTFSTTAPSTTAGRDLVVVKLGGSLITDKRRPETLRPEVLGRLATEIAEARRHGVTILVGHGSGSFGHVAAARAGLGAGPYCATGVLASAEARRGLVATHTQAARLHRRVVDALAVAGAEPFGWAPSTALTAEAGQPVEGRVDALVAALALGLVPVVYGDMLTDRSWGASIASTEAVVDFLIPRLEAAGWRIRRLVWCGETAGIYDAEGESIREVDYLNLDAVRRALGATAGTDVTGGMGLRLETTVALARRGMTSWIIDGTVPDLVRRVLTGEALLGKDLPGTVVRRWAPRRPTDPRGPRPNPRDDAGIDEVD